MQDAAVTKALDASATSVLELGGLLEQPEALLISILNTITAACSMVAAIATLLIALHKGSRG
jgi:hypothetical protein